MNLVRSKYTKSIKNKEKQLLHFRILKVEFKKIRVTLNINLGIKYQICASPYTKNYKTSLRKIHKDLNKWSYTMLMD